MEIINYVCMFLIIQIGIMLSVICFWVCWKKPEEFNAFDGEYIDGTMFWFVSGFLILLSTFLFCSGVYYEANPEQKPFCYDGDIYQKVIIDGTTDYCRKDEFLNIVNPNKCESGKAYSTYQTFTKLKETKCILNN